MEHRSEQVRAPRVTVLGSHPRHGRSMQRYTALLAEAYEQAGVRVRLLRPTGVLSRRMTHPAAAKLAMYLEELVLFPLRLQFDLDRTDLFHVADHSDASWVLLPRLRGRADVTCHDLTAVRAALGEVGAHRPGPTGRLQQRIILAGLRRARTVLAISRATAADVQRLLPGIRVEVLSNPLDTALLDAPSRSDGPGVAGPYVLMVAHDAWYKRRPLALRMWRELRRSAPGLRLVDVGPPFGPAEVEAAGLTDEWPALRDAVDVLAGVDDGRLAALYRGAEALLQSSAYEGFCWPVLEANVGGTVAICTDIPVLREVGPDNLFLEDPDDLQPLARLWAQRKDPDRLAAVETHARTSFTWSRFVDALRDRLE
jgi:glycosyltransferase involved in cell wall biosynthesis